MSHDAWHYQLRRWHFVLPVLLTLLGSVAADRAWAAPHGSARKMPPAASGHRQEQAGVAVTVEALDKDACEAVFGVDLLKHQVQPVLIKIRNDSKQTYEFQKSSVSSDAIPAAAVARYAYPNLIVSVLKWTGHIATFIPRTMSDRKMPSRPLIPGDVRHDFTKEEIADGPIAPQSSREGFVFLHPLPKGQPLRVPLTNASSRQPLVFEFTTG